MNNSSEGRYLLWMFEEIFVSDILNLAWSKPSNTIVTMCWLANNQTSASSIWFALKVMPLEKYAIPKFNNKYLRSIGCRGSIIMRGTNKACRLYWIVERTHRLLRVVFPEPARPISKMYGFGLVLSCLPYVALPSSTDSLADCSFWFRRNLYFGLMLSFITNFERIQNQYYISLK